MKKSFWSLTRREIYVREFEFNCVKLDLFYFLQEFETKEKVWGEEVEILPSIYCWRKTYLPKVLKQYERIYLKFMEVFFYKDLEVFFIENRNIRNYFNIEKEKHPELAKSITDFEYEAIDTYVETEKLPYPDMLHNGCKMWSIFQKLGLYNNEIYSPLSGSQVLKVTSYCENLNELICKKSRCNDFIEKMLNGTFEPIFVKDNSRDAISFLRTFKGYYELEEGKHRICAAKRFRLEKIPATVYQQKIKNPSMEESTRLNFLSPVISKKTFCTEVLKKYKQIYANLGLSEGEMKELTEEIPDEKYIEYIENKAGKSIMELFEEKKHEKYFEFSK